MGRRDELETKNAHALSWWLGYVKDWMNESEVLGDITQMALVDDCVAHGDVPFYPLTR